MANPYAAVAERAVAYAKKQLTDWRLFKQPRMNEILENEAAYAGKVKPALSGRFNAPLPIVSGFVNTILSKIDDPIKGRYMPLHEKDWKGAKKMSAALKYESAPQRGNWNEKDLDAKFFAIMGGVAFLKAYGESYPKFKFCLDAVDYFDMVTEPSGGKYLENHKAAYQENIFMDKTELEAMAKKKFFDPVQVQKLIDNQASTESTKKQVQDEFQNKLSRFALVGLTPPDYGGLPGFNFTETALRFEGKWWYLLFDYKSQIWVRFEPLEKLFGCDMKQWLMWSPHINPTTAWPRGPVDELMPIADVMRIVFNQMLDNLQKLNWDMTAYDKNIFKDPSQLKWRPDGLVKADVPEGKQIGHGIFKFETPQIGTFTINLMDYLNNFVGEKLASSPGAAGNADEKKVGIYLGNQQVIADRFGLVNKLYSSVHVGLLKRFEYAVWKHAPADYMVQVNGPEGIGWENLKKEDTEPEYEAVVESSVVEAEQSQVKAEKREKALDRVYNFSKADPRFAASINPKKVLEETLRIGEWSDEDIRVFMDAENYGDQQLLSEAADAIHKIVIENETPNVNRLATTAYIMKIFYYAYDNADDLGAEKFQKLVTFAYQHWDFALENAFTKARTEATKRIMALNQPPTGLPSAGNSTPAENGTPMPSGGGPKVNSTAVGGY